MSHTIKTRLGKDHPEAAILQMSLGGVPRNGGRENILADGQLIVMTPRGLNPLDRMLIEASAKIPAAYVLSVAVPNATAAMALSALRPEARVTYYHYDLFFIRQAETLAGGHSLQNFQCVCLPDLPREDPAPELILAEVRKDGEAGMTLELIRQAHETLAHGGKLLIAINNPGDLWLRRQLEKTFGALTVDAQDKQGILYLVKRTDRPAADAPPSRHYVKQVEVTFKDEAPVAFETCYGTFNSDGMDEGSRALLDVMVPPEPCQAILDLGCGWGGMGIVAARRTGAKRLVMIDANARAVEMAQRNAARLGVEGVEVRLEADAESLQGGGEVGTYDAVISNPPYATEFRVTDLFINVAWRALRAGGRVWMVGKNNQHMVARTEEIFGNVEVLQRRGYTVVTAVREDTRRYS